MSTVPTIDEILGILPHVVHAEDKLQAYLESHRRKDLLEVAMKANLPVDPRETKELLIKKLKAVLVARQMILSGTVQHFDQVGTA